MKKYLLLTVVICTVCLAAAWLIGGRPPSRPAPVRVVTAEPVVMVVTVVVPAAPGLPPQPLAPGRSNIIATALRNPPTPEPSPTPTPTSTPEAPPQGGRGPTPVPDYSPGQGMAVLTGEPPYELTILPGGWQAYRIGPSADPWGYLVDVNPLGPAPAGAYVESKILPEYSAGRWVDVLWLRAPGILDGLPVSVDLVPTRGWPVTYETRAQLTPGEWTGWGMFDNAEGCGGVLDISPDDGGQEGVAYIENTRVQPEFPGSWIQVIRVQLSRQAAAQAAWLRYYAPGPLGVEALRQEVTLSPGRWNGLAVAPSAARQGYVVEVVPLEQADNEVAFAVVRPESDGEAWQDVLRVYVPEERPPLEALLRVLAVPVAGQ